MFSPEARQMNIFLVPLDFLHLFSHGSHVNLVGAGISGAFEADSAALGDIELAIVSM